MLDKLVGKDGMLWRTGGDGDAESATPPASTPAAGAHVATVLSAATLDPEILALTRKATFDISGSVYARFAAEYENLKDVIADPATRIKVVVKTLRVSPGEIVAALQSTHSAALVNWKASVTKAKEVGRKEKVGARETQLEQLAAEDERVKGEITSRQTRLGEIATQAQTLRGEISSAQTEIDQKTQQYDAAVQATEAELRQLITTLQSIT